MCLFSACLSEKVIFNASIPMHVGLKKSQYCRHQNDYCVWKVLVVKSLGYKPIWSVSIMQHWSSTWEVQKAQSCCRPFQWVACSLASFQRLKLIRTCLEYLLNGGQQLKSKLTRLLSCKRWGCERLGHRWFEGTAPNPTRLKALHQSPQQCTQEPDHRNDTVWELSWQQRYDDDKCFDWAVKHITVTNNKLSVLRHLDIFPDMWSMFSSTWWVISEMRVGI